MSSVAGWPGFASSCDGLVATVQVVRDLGIRLKVAKEISDGDGGFGYPEVCDGDGLRRNCGGSSGSAVRDVR